MDRLKAARLFAVLALVFLVIVLLLVRTGSERTDNSTEPQQLVAPEAPSPLVAGDAEVDTQVTTDTDIDASENAVTTAANDRSGLTEQTVSSIAEEEPEPSSYLPGLTAADIKLNLQKAWGFEFSGPRKLETVFVDHGEVVDSDTGALLQCDIYESTPLKIESVEFMIDSSAAMGIVDVGTIDALAEGFFGYCATIPYDDSDPTTAKNWVAGHAKSAKKAGKVLTTTVGSAQFELYGTEWMRFLEVKPAK
ncbi:MAG: hypothetical protein ACM3ZU_07945 [Bacteroidota bacterium]